MTQAISRLLAFTPPATCKADSTHCLPPVKIPQVSIKYSPPHEHFNPPANHSGAFPIPAFFPGEDINVTVEIINTQQVPVVDLQLGLVGEASVHHANKAVRQELLSVGVSLVDKITMWNGNARSDVADVDMNQEESSPMWLPFRPTEALSREETVVKSTNRILPPGKYSLPLTITIPFFTDLPSSFRHNTHSISYSISCTLQIPPSTIESLVGISNNSRIFASLALNLIPLISVPPISPPIISDEILHPAGSQVVSSGDTNAGNSISDSPRSTSSAWSSVSDLISSLSSSAELNGSSTMVRSGNYALQVYLPRRTFAQNTKIPISLHVVNHSDESEGQIVIRRAFIAKALVEPNFTPCANSRSPKRRRISKRQNLRSTAFAWITTSHRRARRVFLGSKDDVESVYGDADDEDEHLDESNSQAEDPQDTLIEMWKLAQVNEIKLPSSSSTESDRTSREFALSFSLDIPRGCGFSIPPSSTMNLFGISFKVGIEVEFLHGRQSEDILDDERDIVTIWVPITVGSIKVADGSDGRSGLTSAIDEEELPPPVYEQAVKDVPAYTREASTSSHV